MKQAKKRKSIIQILIELYKESIKNVPLLKYSWVLIATICILALTAYFRLDNSDVFLYAIFVLIISLLAYGFSLLLKTQDFVIRIATYILVYSIIITMGAAVIGFASYIFKGEPKFYERLLPKMNTSTALYSGESQRLQWFLVGNYSFQLWAAINRNDQNSSVLITDLDDLSKQLSFRNKDLIDAILRGGVLSASSFIESVTKNEEDLNCFLLGMHWESLYNSVGVAAREDNIQILSQVIEQTSVTLEKLKLLKTHKSLSAWSKNVLKYQSDMQQFNSLVPQFRNSIDDILRYTLTPELSE